MSRKPAGLDPDIATSSLSIRMILFIIVLSALHISGIEPRKPPTILATGGPVAVSGAT
jgi:hypothetical protein